MTLPADASDLPAAPSLILSTCTRIAFNIHYCLASGPIFSQIRRTRRVMREIHALARGAQHQYTHWLARKFFSDHAEGHAARNQDSTGLALHEGNL